MASFPWLHIKIVCETFTNFYLRWNLKHWITCLRKDVPTRKYLTWVFSKFVHACIIFLDAFDFHYSYHSSFPQSDTSFMWPFWFVLVVDQSKNACMTEFENTNTKSAQKWRKEFSKKMVHLFFVCFFFLCEINSPNKCYPLCRLFTLWYPFSFWAMKGCSCSNYKSLSSQQYLAFSWTSTSLSVFSM